VTVTYGTDGLRVGADGAGWRLAGPGSARFALVNDYLAYLAGRRYSSRTVRSYAFDLLHFCRWLVTDGTALDAVETDTLLRFLAACREEVLPGQHGGNVVGLRTGRAAGYAAATVNRRLAAISGLFAFRAMRDPAAPNPVPRGAAARRTAKGERSGMLGHLARPRARSLLRLREPRRLPRGLDREEARALLASFRCDRDRAVAGLMLFSGLRSAEVLGLQVADFDVGRGWVRVTGKGGKERRVPVDPEVAGLIQSYLLAERPETSSSALFVVAKGPHRGRPLSAEGLRRVFRYHRGKARVPAGHPHALRHTFGTALAEAGVDLSVMQALMGHDHVDSAAAYIHLSPAHVRRAYDEARARQRAIEAAR
jgi:integrase/recombinase XerC